MSCVVPVKLVCRKVPRFTVGPVRLSADSKGAVGDPLGIQFGGVTDPPVPE